MSKRQQINFRVNSYIALLIEAMCDIEKCSKTELLNKSIEYYSLQVLDPETLIKLKKKSLER